MTGDGRLITRVKGDRPSQVGGCGSNERRDTVCGPLSRGRTRHAETAPLPRLSHRMSTHEDQCVGED